VAEYGSPFQQLQGRLSALISSIAPGEQLPSEPKLAKHLGVSRATLREAMRTFEGQGLIRRRQGLGTFVVGRPKIIESGLEILESIETLARKIDLDVSMGEMKVEWIKADLDQAKSFVVDPGSPLIKIARVIIADNRPVAYLIDILPENILSPADLQIGFTGSVLDFLLRRGSPHLANSRAEIRAEAAPSEIARALQIQRGDVLLLFQASLYDEIANVVDLSSSYFLPGYFRFHVVRRLESPFQKGKLE
jgi:GntR family transcriptional regulator